MENIEYKELNIKLRTCKKCGEDKELEDFVKVKYCNNGRTYECKECLNKNLKEYKRKYYRKYRDENSKEIADYQKDYHKSYDRKKPKGKRKE